VGLAAEGILQRLAGKELKVLGQADL